MLHSRVSVSLSFALLLSSVGCQGYKFEQKCPEGITESKITAPAIKPVPADILFVVDNSASMADEQANLAANFDFFINQIAGGNSDYQIAIVSTDQDSSDGEKDGLVSIAYSEASSYRYLESISGDSCTSASIDHGCFRGPMSADRIIRSNQPAADQIALFQDNVNVGSCGSGNEAGLKAMADALNKTRPGQCNEGFVREDANLIIIFVSDEEDTDNTPINQYVQDIIDIKKDESKIRVAAIVGSVNGDPSDCSINEADACGTICQTPPAPGSQAACTPGAANQCPADEYCATGGQCENKELQYWSNQNCSWCTYFDVADCCSALAGNRYIRFARAVEDRVVAADPEIEKSDCKAAPGDRTACLVDSICQDSFGATLERIAKDLIIVNTYTLDPAPENPAGIAVRVSGGRFGDGVDLVYGEDFEITSNGTVGTLKITAADNTPSQADEKLNVSYVSEISQPTEQKGACGPNTSTTALSRQ